MYFCSAVCKMSLREKREKEEDVHTHKAASLEPCVSMKRDGSMRISPHLSDGAVTSDTFVL